MGTINKTKIEWCDYTWNPVTGCEHNCSYCYARKIANRFTGNFNPTIHHNRLSQPDRCKNASTIFVVSMGDLFGDWVETDWICAVYEVMERNPQHTFMTLTKNPKRYKEFKPLNNVMRGVTMDIANIDRWNDFRGVDGRKFVSCEPLLSDMSIIDFSSVELVIVGAEKTLPPKKEWIDSIKHDNIFYKNNIKPFLAQTKITEGK